MRRKVKPRGEVPPAEAENPASAPPPPPKASPAKRYRVAKRQGVSTLQRGVIGGGEEVSCSDLAGGEARVSALVRAGYLIEVES